MMIPSDFTLVFKRVNYCMSLLNLLSQLHATKMTSRSQVQICRLNGDQATAYQPTDFSLHLLIFEDQIFLTLTRIHQGFYEKNLAVRFKTSISTVSRIIIMWANYLYFLLSYIPIRPSHAKVDDTMPACFKVQYPWLSATGGREGAPPPKRLLLP